jgi:hypothetical protein
VRGIELTGNGTTAHLYNNTFVEVSPAFLGNSPSDLIVVRNTIALACGGFVRTRDEQFRRLEQHRR